MDQNRLRKICEMSLETRGVGITEFRTFPTSNYDDEKGDWVINSYSLFLGVRKKETTELQSTEDLEQFLESLFGFECVVEFV